MPEERIAAVVLAGGHGFFTDGSSKLIEFLCPDSKTTIIQSTVSPLRQLDLPIFVVCNEYYNQQIKGYLSDFEDHQFTCQQYRNGTAGAVNEIICRFSEIGLRDAYDHLLVIHGDMPLLEKETLSQLIEKHLKDDATITMLTLTASVDDLPEMVKKYARVIKEDGQIARIVEPHQLRDFTQEEGLVVLCPSVWIFKISWLRENLIPLDKRLQPHQKGDGYSDEFWLLDLIWVASLQERKICELTVFDHKQLIGVNTPEDLNAARMILQKRKCQEVL